MAVIREVMGRWHAYYAEHSRSVGGRGLVLEERGNRLGSVVFYEAKLGSITLGVIYYVAVKPRYRGQGLGKILVLSAEELMNPDLYVSTLQSSNMPSRKMFESICYKPYTWSQLEEFSSMLAEAIYRSTCSYEDDLVMIKGGISGVRLDGDSLKRARRIWDIACYKPWKRLNST